MNAPKFTPERQAIETQYEEQIAPWSEKFQRGEITFAQWNTEQRKACDCYWSRRAALAKAVA